MFDRVARFYALGLYTAAQVAQFVARGRLTAAQYQEITGAQYAPEKEETKK